MGAESSRCSALNTSLVFWASGLETDLTKGIQDDEARYEMIRRRTPAGRWGKPDDLAGAVVYLASAASDYVTGSTLTVDGGFIISA